jgi:putrescine transport system ATP-binding protein
MDRGEIVQVGSPTEIYEYPISKFVADFIGSVNMFEGRLIEDEPNFVRIQAPELSCNIYVDHGISSAPGAAVWAATRPEKIEISRQEPSAKENRAKGVVREIAYMGDLSIFLVQIDSGKMVQVTLPNTVRQINRRLSWDETVWLSWDASSPVILPQ